MRAAGKGDLASRGCSSADDFRRQRSLTKFLGFSYWSQIVAGWINSNYAACVYKRECHRFGVFWILACRNAPICRFFGVLLGRS